MFCLLPYMLPSGIVPYHHSLGLAISALFSSIPLSMYGNLLVVYCLSHLCVCGACVCVVDYACLMCVHARAVRVVRGRGCCCVWENATRYNCRQLV